MIVNKFWKVKNCYYLGIFCDNYIDSVFFECIKIWLWCLIDNVWCFSIFGKSVVCIIIVRYVWIIVVFNFLEFVGNCSINCYNVVGVLGNIYSLKLVKFFCFLEVCYFDKFK